MTTPLKLKSERIGKVKLTSDRPFLSVLVDTGVFHLSDEYTYSLPEKFDVEPGDWVSVPFNGRNCLGLVTERKNKNEISKVSPINRSAKGPFIGSQHLTFYRAVASRWAVPIFDVLRFVTKHRNPARPYVGKTSVGERIYLQLNPSQNEIAAITEIGLKSAKRGRTLVIVPELRLANALQNSHFEVAMRGSILSPESYEFLIVVREDSEHHYELKSPGFNTRDVALLRNEWLGENVLFLGYSPSLEMLRLIESNFVKYKSGSGKVAVIAKPSQQGELIPSSLVKVFKENLRRGSVLVIAPSKGYGLAISCASCRNLAKCDCGGKLSKSSRNALPACVLCVKPFENWSCQYCNNKKIYLLGRGIERIAEDFGRSFANTPIHISTAEKIIEDEVPNHSIILATIGSVPNIKYEAVLFLEGLNQSADMRSEERFLSTIFRYTAATGGNAIIVERAEHPAVNSLIKWNPLPYLSRLLTEYREANLPPSTRHILLKSDVNERVYSGLQSALREKRLPPQTRIHNIGDGVISIFFPIKHAKETINFIYEYQRRRSMSGKSLLKVRIDPYLLG